MTLNCVLSVSFCVLFVFLENRLANGQQDQRDKILRYCVPDALAEECIGMKANVGADKINCVIGRDRLHCMEKVQTGVADLVQVPVDDIYVAGDKYGLKAFMMEEINRSEYAYHPVAVVKRSSNIRSLRDLRSKNSCHTGMGRTAGYNVPIAALIASGVMPPDCRGELYTVSRFFNSSCIPGSWTSSPHLDGKLKAEVPNLCSLCKDPKACDSKDEYAGYNGAMKCLLEGDGDVAFTKLESVETYLRENPGKSHQLDLLCLDGSRMNAEDSNRMPLCSWGRKPTTAFMGSDSKKDDMASYHRTISQIYNNFKSNRPSWFEKILVRSSTTSDIILVPRTRQTYTDYLGTYVKSIQRELPNCESKSISLCVTSQIEQRKCQDLSASAYTRRIQPVLRCHWENSIADCIDAVYSRKADIMILESSDVYRTGRDKDLKPLATEVYGDGEMFYYAVAVIKENSQITELSQLKGKHSCHTGLGQTSGWIIPVVALLQENLLHTAGRNCDRLGPVADFFAASCVPGSNNTQLVKNATLIDRLCQQCQGDEHGAFRCSKGAEELYSGQMGSFRCLVDNQGDVTFSNHWTPMDMTRGRSKQLWARGLRSMDFKLLCRHGGIASLQEYETCNMARVPAHNVMISTKASEEVQQDASIFLAKAAEAFGPSSTSHLFKLFGTYQGVQDLIFIDHTTSLRILDDNETYQTVLGDEFQSVMKIIEPDECLEVSSAGIPQISILLICIVSLFGFFA